MLKQRAKSTIAVPKFLRRMHFVDYFNYLLLILFTILMIYPFLYIFSLSVSDSWAVFTGQVWLFPVGFKYDVYEAVFDTNPLRGYTPLMTGLEWYAEHTGGHS